MSPPGIRTQLPEHPSVSNTLGIPSGAYTCTTEHQPHHSHGPLTPHLLELQELEGWGWRHHERLSKVDPEKET